MVLPIKSPLADLQHQHPSEMAGSILLGPALPLDPGQLCALDPRMAVSAGMPFPFAVFGTPSPYAYPP